VDHLNGLLPRDDRTGLFSPKGLLAYAQKNFDEPTTPEDRAREADAKAAKIDADLKLKSIMVKRNQIKLDVESGLVIEVERYERALAYRLAFFKNEVEVLGSQVVDAMVERFGVSPALKGEILEWWSEATAGWLDAFSQDREFTVDLDLEEVSPGLLYGGKRMVSKMRQTAKESAREKVRAASEAEAKAAPKGRPRKAAG
jgi:hypothetical protein